MFIKIKTCHMHISFIEPKLQPPNRHKIKTRIKYVFYLITFLNIEI